MNLSTIEINSSAAICSKCGKSYGRRKGYFPVNYGILYKGVGYVTVCKTCIDNMYNGYLSQCNNSKDAVRQICRKLDLYWNEKVFNIVDRTNTTSTMMTSYIAKLASVTYSGKSYDDTLAEEGTLWNWNISHEDDVVPALNTPVVKAEGDTTPEEVDESVVAFWGTGYTPDMYRELEQRRSYWMSRFPESAELDIGTEAIIRQICNLEIDINRDRVAGKSIEKSVNALNNLLGSASLKPAQRKNEEADAELSNVPLGVWTWRWEKHRPVPEPEKSLRDVNHIKKYVFTWMGHVLKMVGRKNCYTKLYEEEIARLRVERPEYVDDDEEDLLIHAYSEEEGDA